MHVSCGVGLRPFHSRGKDVGGVREPKPEWERVGGSGVGGATGWRQEYAVQGQAAGSCQVNVNVKRGDGVVAV